MLQGLRTRGTLSGNDFVPVVVKLDELINHLGQIQALQLRVLALRTARSPEAQPDVEQSDTEHDSHEITTVLAAAAAVPPPRGRAGSDTGTGTRGVASAGSTGDAAGAAATGAPPPHSPLDNTLQGLTEETATALGRTVRLRTSGLEQVPPYYAPVVRNICIQMIRNAVAHGIESPNERRRQGKAHEGLIQISFSEEVSDDEAGYRLTVEDDGQGLRYEGIVDKALRLGVITPQQAASLERAAIYRLIFQPGFSTSEQISEHSGRGVGLDAVSMLVREHGGKIGVSTVTGRYTRFRVMLPRAPSVAASSAA
jgi:two-component system, chemotaxis family, sensor kinase CheA